MQDAIMWYSRDEHHGNERLKVMGLQCLVNFHINAPTGTFHEAILPCLNRLGQSATTGIRRYLRLRCATSFGTRTDT